MLTCVLSGPSAGRAPLLARLNRAGVGIDASPERMFNPSHGLPRDEQTEWITCHAESLASVEGALERSGWALRMHHEKPEPAPPERDVLAELDALQREVAALRGGR